MHWIDSHIHLSSFPASSHNVLYEKSRQKNLNKWLMAGYDFADWQNQLHIHNTNALRCFGVHPWKVIELSDQELQLQMQHLRSLYSQAHSLGETGVDGFRTKDKSLIHKQLVNFEEHLELNKQDSKPMTLHIVKCHAEALALLKKYSYKGLVHGYSGAWNEAQGYIDLGYKISVGRGVFQRGYHKLKETVEKIPLECLLLESDAFYSAEETEDQAVAIYFQVVEAVCKIKNISQEELQLALFHNIQSLFEAKI